MIASDLHLEQPAFSSFTSFQSFLHEHGSAWPAKVQRALRLMALHGIRDPLSDAPVPSEAIRVEGSNYRETVEVEGLLSRHRAVLLIFRQAIEAGDLPPLDRLRLYAPEALSPFARLLEQGLPGFIGSECLLDPAHPLRRSVRHEDLCDLSLPSGSLDAVICNEVFEHLYDLPAALDHLARVLRPDGLLLATFPFAYDREASILKAEHRLNGPPHLLTEPEIHGDPLDPAGSLVYRIPGWDILEHCRQAGFQRAEMLWIEAPSYGILGQEIPAVFVLRARR